MVSTAVFLYLFFTSLTYRPIFAKLKPIFLEDIAMIGRKKELMKLKEAMESDQSEFIAVYGRRRVGKTFLIRQAFPLCAPACPGNPLTETVVPVFRFHPHFRTGVPGSQMSHSDFRWVCTVPKYQFFT